MIDACLNSLGTGDVSIEVLIIFRRAGKSGSRHSFRIFVGMGSRGNDFVGVLRMIFLKTSAMTGGKHTRLGTGAPI